MSRSPSPPQARRGPAAAQAHAAAARQNAVRKGTVRQSAAPPNAAETALDHVSFTIGKVYYGHLVVLERLLAEAGLMEHLRPGMGHVLFALFEQDDRTIKGLVDRAGLSYSTLSGLVSRMKRAKLITCRTDPADGRAVRVRLTPLGKSLEPRCRATLAKIDAIMLAGTSPGQLRTTRVALQRMADALRQYETRHRGKKGAEPAPDADVY